MNHETSFEAALESEQGKRKRGRGPVRAWRSTLSPSDRLAFDSAIDDRDRVATADIQRAIATMSDRAIDYGRVYRYRESVRRGEER